MKKIIFILFAVTICAKENLNISIGTGVGIKENIYSGKNEEFVYPYILLRYKEMFLSPNSIGYSIKDDGLSHTLSLENFYRTNLLDSGDLEGLIKDNREMPFLLGFESTKKMDNVIIGLGYKREFVSEGNLVDLSISRMTNYRSIPKFIVISSLKYTGYDKKYSNYYYNFTESEFKSRGEEYKNNNFVNEINGNLTLMYKISNKIITNLNFGILYLDENKITNEKNGINSSVLMGINYSF